MEAHDQHGRDMIMKLTKHAQERMNERNVNLNDVVAALNTKGKPCRQRANRTVYYKPMGKRVLVVMVADGNAVTTVFWTENKRKG